MSRIKHPNPQQGTFTDRIGGVVFHDGFAEVDLTEDPNLADAYRMHGYEVEEIPDVAKAKHPAGRGKRTREVHSYGHPPVTEITEEVEFAVVELPDGTVIGDGKSLATLYAADEA